MSGDGAGAARRVSMEDVAAAAGVSVTTVSRALSGRGDLPAATRVRVQEAARSLGYQRAGTSRGRPSSTEPRMVELVLGAFDDAFTEEVSAGARQGAARFGYDLVLTLERDLPEDDWPTRVAERRSAGVILGLIQPTRSQLSQLEGLNIPIVLLEPTSEPHGRIHSVSTTNWQGGYDAGAHLAALGLDRFVCVTGEPRFRFGRARESGFRQAVEEHRPGAPLDIVRSDWTERAVTDALAPLTTFGPVGVFTCNDNMAAGVYAAAQRLRLRIPEDISVVGFDDTARWSSLKPALTTIRQPIRAIAARAVEMIQQLRHGQEVLGDRLELPTRLVVRESTAIQRSDGAGADSGERPASTSAIG